MPELEWRPVTPDEPGCVHLDGYGIGPSCLQQRGSGKPMHTSVRRRCGLTYLPMINQLRTCLARFIVQHFNRPGPLLIQAWLWLAAQTDDIEEKKRCLWAILDLVPDNTRALLALLAFVLEKADD